MKNVPIHSSKHVSNDNSLNVVHDIDNHVKKNVKKIWLKKVVSHDHIHNPNDLSSKYDIALRNNCDDLCVCTPKTKWVNYDNSNDEKRSSDESSSEEELVSNFVGFMASYSSLDDVSQNSLENEVDKNHQVCMSENPTYDELLAKVKCLEDSLKIALSEEDEKNDLIKIQVDELVSTTRRLLGEKNSIIGL